MLTLIQLGSASAQQADCNRDCLSATLMRCMNAVVANAPKGANLIAGFRQTENAVVKALGKGTWQTVTGLGEIQG